MKPLLIDLDHTLTDAYFIKEVNVSHFNNPWHIHADYELVLIQESQGKRIVGDHIENFEKGDLILLGPNLPHAWFNDKEYYDQPEPLYAKAIVVYLKASWLENDITKLPGSAKFKKLLELAKRGIKIKGEVSQTISNSLVNIQKSSGLKQTIDMLSILHQLAESNEYELLASVGYVNAHHEDETQRMNKVYGYLMNNFNSIIKLKEVSSIANMTPNSFCRYFKLRTQKTFSQFVNEIRIGHACKLLHQKDKPISQICFESGFQNLTNFNKFFKKITGKNPMEYRRQLNVSTLLNQGQSTT